MICIHAGQTVAVNSFKYFFDSRLHPVDCEMTMFSLCQLKHYILLWYLFCCV